MKITVARKFFAAGALIAGLALSACTSHEVPTQNASLYDRLGGKPAIEAVVNQFIQNVAADDRINAFFANVDANDLSAKLVDQICQASGGPCTYTGRDMKTAHEGMGVKEEHFNALVEDLIAALDQFNVPEREKNELLGALGPMKGDIVES
jgi:hemoglobin